MALNHFAPRKEGTLSRTASPQTGQAGSIWAQARHRAAWPQGRSFTRAPGPPQGQNTLLCSGRFGAGAAAAPTPPLENTGMGGGPSVAVGALAPTPALRVKEGIAGSGSGAGGGCFM